MPQWDCRRGTITIKSNPIPTGWVTHKRENSNGKVLQLLWRFWTPHQTSQPGDPTKGLGTSKPDPWLWRTAGFDYRSSTGLGETETPILECTNKVFCTPRPRGKEQWPHKRLNQKYLLVLEGLLWSVGQQGLTTGTGTLAALGQEGPPWHKPSWSSPVNSTVAPRAELPQAKQLSGRGCNPTQQQIMGLKLSWARFCPPEFFPSRIPPSGSLHKSLSLVHQKANRRSKKQSHRKKYIFVSVTEN